MIATTMADAYQTADTIIADWTRGEPMLNNPENSTPKTGSKAILEKLSAKGHRAVSYKDWKKIEQKEFELGARAGKPREKFLTVEEMLKVLD